MAASNPSRGQQMEAMNLPTTPLDVAKAEARRIEGLLELWIGHAQPWFIAFRSTQPPGAIIIYHSPAGKQIGFTRDATAVGSLVLELCECLNVSPFE